VKGREEEKGRKGKGDGKEQKLVKLMKIVTCQI